MEYLAFFLGGFLATSFLGWHIAVRYVEKWGPGDDLVMTASALAWPLLLVLEIAMLVKIT